MTITADEVRALLDYDPETGVFRWKVNRGRIRAGATAGTLDDMGYCRISIGDRRHMAHRLAWMHVHGCWPPHDIDHKNGAKGDNRLTNLRAATRGENMQNVAAQRKNASKLGMGVKRTLWGRFEARIKLNGKDRHLGTFNSPEEAHAAYLRAKRELHPFAPEPRATNRPQEGA